MKFMFPYVVPTIAAIIVGLSLLKVLSHDNPVVDVAEDIVCEFTDKQICEDIKAMEDDAT